MGVIAGNVNKCLVALNAAKQLGFPHADRPMGIYLMAALVLSYRIGPTPALCAKTARCGRQYARDAKVAARY